MLTSFITPLRATFISGTSQSELSIKNYDHLKFFRHKIFETQIYDTSIQKAVKAYKWYNISKIRKHTSCRQWELNQWTQIDQNEIYQNQWMKPQRHWEQRKMGENNTWRTNESETEKRTNDTQMRTQNVSQWHPKREPKTWTKDT